MSKFFTSDVEYIKYKYSKSNINVDEKGWWNYITKRPEHMPLYKCSRCIFDTKRFIELELKTKKELLKFETKYKNTGACIMCSIHCLRMENCD